MNHSALPYEPTKPYAAPEWSVSSLDNTASQRAAQPPSTQASAKSKTQSRQDKSLAVGGTGPSAVDAGTDANTDVPEIRVQRDQFDGFPASKEVGTSWLSRRKSKK